MFFLLLFFQTVPDVFHYIWRNMQRKNVNLTCLLITGKGKNGKKLKNFTLQKNRIFPCSIYSKLSLGKFPVEQGQINGRQMHPQSLSLYSAYARPLPRHSSPALLTPPLSLSLPSTSPWSQTPKSCVFANSKQKRYRRPDGQMDGRTEERRYGQTLL